jgi:hypothetical protein
MVSHVSVQANIVIDKPVDTLNRLNIVITLSGISLFLILKPSRSKLRLGRVVIILANAGERAVSRLCHARSLDSNERACYIQARLLPRDLIENSSETKRLEQEERQCQSRGFKRLMILNRKKRN